MYRLLFCPITTPCGHSFCQSCLSRAFDHSPFCPICRASLAEVCCMCYILSPPPSLSISVLPFLRSLFFLFSSLHPSLLILSFELNYMYIISLVFVTFQRFHQHCQQAGKMVSCWYPPFKFVASFTSECVTSLPRPYRTRILSSEMCWCSISWKPMRKRERKC